LLRELAPATRHLGLEKIVVRLVLRERPRGGAEQARELVVEPTAGGRIDVAWRDPHHEPLRAASDTERRLVQARRRGTVYPYDAVRLFTADGSCFEEFDLAPGAAQPTAVSVAGRAAGSNACGVVFGLITTATAKHPEGMTRVLVLSDPTHELGALAAAECDRLVAALDLAAARGLPLEWIATSAGARIAMDSGTENLDATARVVRRIVQFTAGGGEINLVVAGVNVGAQSYFDALATMLLHTRGILIMLPGSSMVLTGRLALEASGGVAAEDEGGIGGFERIMGPNGQAQYYARDLAAGYEILLAHYGFTYRAPGEARPRRHPTDDPASRSIATAPYSADEPEGFASIGEIFDDTTNPGRKRPFAMRPVMLALIDQDGGWLERWAPMAGAETAIVWDAHLGGHAVCLIGIESRNLPRLGARAPDGPEQWSGGTLFPLSSKKIARALRAASGVRPAVILANLSGFDGSPESMRTLQLEYGAEIARAVVEFNGPLLFAVVARYHGGAYVVFSRALNEQLYAVALDGSYASVIGGGAAATAVFAREVEARSDADPRIQAAREALRAERDPERAAALRVALERLREEIVLAQHGEVAAAFDAVHTVERAHAVGSLDRIISVAELRRCLIERLDATASAAPPPRRVQR
jgi:acetyl-CoA carboxylase carboxyltransferase component